MPVVRGVDGFFGLFGQAFVAILACYALLSALVAMEKAFGPSANAPALTLAQVQAMQRLLTENPIDSNLVDRGDFRRLQDQARKPTGARIAEAPQLNQLASVYEDFLQPQLAGSRLAPIVLGIGQRVPGVGRFGPSDLPRRILRVTTTPGAAPTPTPR
jgi:hypothetical protein